MQSVHIHLIADTSRCIVCLSTYVFVCLNTSVHARAHTYMHAHSQTYTHIHVTMTIVADVKKIVLPSSTHEQKQLKLSKKLQMLGFANHT